MGAQTLSRRRSSFVVENDGRVREARTKPTPTMKTVSLHLNEPKVGVPYVLNISWSYLRSCSLLPGTRSDTKTPAGCRSPLKEQNVAPEEQGEEECCMSTSTKTPAARGEWSIRPDMLLRRLTQCFVTLLPTCGCRLSNFGRSSGPSNIGYDLSDSLGLFRDGFRQPSSHIARQAVTWNVLVESWILQ